MGRIEIHVIDHMFYMGRLAIYSNLDLLHIFTLFLMDHLKYRIVTVLNFNKQPQDEQRITKECEEDLTFTVKYNYNYFRSQYLQ